MIDDAVAVGGDLEPHTLLQAYRRGIFPMHIRRRLVWWLPQQRGVLEPREFHVSRSLRRSAKGFRVSVDQAFARVVEGCADPRRPHGWINRMMKNAYLEMHAAGYAHSIEVWNQDGE